MRSEALDITIETRGHAVWLVLSGPFHNEQVPNIREKMDGLVEDGNKRLVIDLEHVTSLGDQVAQMFVHAASLIRGKGGDMKFVFRNAAVTAAFGTYRNILDIHADSRALSRGGLLGLLRYRGAMLSRKTGVRLSRNVALFVLFVLCGWFLSLAFIVQMQTHRIRQQEQELHGLHQWREDAQYELQTLRERLKPMEQLGLLKDAPKPRARPLALPAAGKKPPAPAPADTVAPVAPTADTSAPAEVASPDSEAAIGDSAATLSAQAPALSAPATADLPPPAQESQP